MTCEKTELAKKKVRNAMHRINRSVWKNILRNKTKKEKVSDCVSCETVPCKLAAKISLLRGKQPCTKHSNTHSYNSQSSSFTDEFALGEQLGKGNFATVRLGRRKSQNNSYAVKIIKTDKLSNHEKKLVKNEAKILQSLTHPNILKLYSVFKEKSNLYFVTEYLSGGTLFDRVVAKDKYPENEAREVSRILLEAIEYCHDQNVVHRDLKPENLLLVSNEDDIQIKVADFGFAKHVPEAGLKTGLGSPLYIAPEILSRKPYGKRIDMWSIGVIVYILLSGQYPFVDDSVEVLDKKIRNAEYDFSDDEWDSVSDNAKAFVTKLLVVDPSLRLSAEQALSEEWVLEKSETTNITADNGDLKSLSTISTLSASYTSDPSSSDIKNSISTLNEVKNWESHSFTSSTSSSSNSTSSSEEENFTRKLKEATNSVIYQRSLAKLMTSRLRDD